MSDILDTIRNARDGSMVDIRYESDGKGAIASFPIKELQRLVPPELTGSRPFTPCEIDEKAREHIDFDIK